MDLVSCVVVTPERLSVPLLSSSPSPRYSEEKGLGDEEPRTGQTMTSHHNASLGQARIEPFDRPDTSWERESESSLSTDNQNDTRHPARVKDSQLQNRSARVHAMVRGESRMASIVEVRAKTRLL